MVRAACYRISSKDWWTDSERVSGRHGILGQGGLCGAAGLLTTRGREGSVLTGLKSCPRSLECCTREVVQSCRALSVLSEGVKACTPRVFRFARVASLRPSTMCARGRAGAVSRAPFCSVASPVPPSRPRVASDPRAAGPLPSGRAARTPDACFAHLILLASGVHSWCVPP